MRLIIIILNSIHDWSEKLNIDTLYVVIWGKVPKHYEETFNEHPEKFF